MSNAIVKNFRFQQMIVKPAKDDRINTRVRRIGKCKGRRSCSGSFLSWGEYISHGFYIFCVRQFMQLSLYQPHSSSYAFSFYLMVFPRQDRMPRNGRRRENKTKKERIT